MTKCVRVFIIAVAVVLPVSALRAEPIDLTNATVVAPAGLSGPENKAVALLIEEIERRTQVRLPRSESWPKVGQPIIAVGPHKLLGEKREAITTHKFWPEGYRLETTGDGLNTVVWVLGDDARGVLFGVGHLLRTLKLERDKLTLPMSLHIATAPHYPLRGHQLGYRPKTNSYDGWDLAQWERYIRDLAVFGTNAIELVPPRSDDDRDSPHFPLSPIKTMAGMSRICADYGLDVWIWYPAMDKDYSDPKTVESALLEWGAVFEKLPRVDAVFVPGGDPGHTQPRYLMALLEKQTAVLHKHHPKATMWVAPQSFSTEWLDEFFAIVRKEPSWLAGVVYGPQTRIPLEQLRAAIPARYPIRHYPDITHSRTCQYPVPDWDAAFAVTEAREIINPRPRGQASIFRLLQPHTNGYITYSEGCNDDVNKIVWSALGWSPKTDVDDILRDYARYFISAEFADSFAQGLLALERNWEGPVLTNTGIPTTLAQFQALERAATPRDKLNWRFQQALYRAYYDAYVRSRLIYETHLEEEAMALLRQARRVGALKVVADAETTLSKTLREPVALDLRARVFELAEALFQSIHMQLSVERYQALSVNRGANLDTIDRPLNNRLWLQSRFAAIRAADSEAERLRLVDEILHWTDPGPGGFYDDIGNPTAQPHLLRGPGFASDPAFFVSPSMIFDDKPTLRKSWWDQALAHYDASLHMRYTGLDKAGHYKLRAVYGGGPMRLVANEKIEIHPLLTKAFEVLEFDLPGLATETGTLDLRWTSKPGRGGNGRGCQLAEVWLIKK